jgi:hypothetical protein
MSELTKELMELVWGTKSSPGLSDTIFCRWTQGISFEEAPVFFGEVFLAGLFRGRAEGTPLSYLV